MSWWLSGHFFNVHAALSVALFVLHLLVMARAITRADRTPASRVAWVAVIAFLPLLGVIAYLLLGETSIGRERVRHLHEVETRMPVPQAEPLPVALSATDAPVFALAKSINGFTPTAGNRITLLGDPHTPATNPMADSNAAIAALVRDIDEAREHVHIGFYIWLDDHNGGKVADAVCAAAKRGVACRVMVDALGSRAFIHSPRWKQLRDAGVRAVATLNDIPRLGHLAIGRLDLRNHRKIVVVDNRIAYCGSQNCADPEFRVEAGFAPWIDILLRCEGPVVRQAQWIFLSAWIAETGEALESLPSAHPMPETFSPGVIAQMFGTGPTDAGNPMSDMFVAAICSARNDLLITTPYFVPDESILRALCATARRDVQVTIIFPARNNSRLVGNSCRSCYDDLLRNGVRIFEYPLGLLHTKSITIDGTSSLVGSANMDRRSLQLNFENNLLVVDEALTATIRERQRGYLSVSREVTMQEVQAWPFHQRLMQDAIGMMAPLL